LSGPAAVLGGAFWIVGAVVTALKPEGCIGDACDLPGRSMRTGGALDAALFLAAVLLIALGAVTVVLRARGAGRLGTAGRAGLAVGLAGVALLLAGGVVQALLLGGDFPYMPLFVLPGALALVTGLLLLGIAILRAGVLPRWAGVLLVVGALSMLGFNDQNAQALLAIPFGLAWVATGYALWSGQGEQPVQV
jgi:hypothetical protein